MNTATLRGPPMGRRKKDPKQSVWNHDRYAKGVEAWYKAHPGSRIEDFCHEVGMSVSTARRLYEPGQDPGIFLVSCIADVFGVDVEELTLKK
jgi:hypothetical protein